MQQFNQQTWDPTLSLDQQITVIVEAKYPILQDDCMRTRLLKRAVQQGYRNQIEAALRAGHKIEEYIPRYD